MSVYLVPLPPEMFNGIHAAGRFQQLGVECICQRYVGHLVVFERTVCRPEGHGIMEHTVFRDVDGEPQVFVDPHPAHVVPVRTGADIHRLVRSEGLVM